MDQQMRWPRRPTPPTGDLADWRFDHRVISVLQHPPYPRPGAAARDRNGVENGLDVSVCESGHGNDLTPHFAKEKPRRIAPPGLPFFRDCVAEA
jgi:hypothetical protein